MSIQKFIKSAFKSWSAVASCIVWTYLRALFKYIFSVGCVAVVAECRGERKGTNSLFFFSFLCPLADANFRFGWAVESNLSKRIKKKKSAMHLQAWKKTRFFGEIFTSDAPSLSSPFHWHVPPFSPFAPDRHSGCILSPSFSRSFWQFEL